MTYEPLLNHSDYEINTQYPYEIRKVSTGKVVSEYVENTGYIRLNLNGNKYSKHVLVALQFIPNDDPELFVEVHHRNHVRTDYHVENLTWITKSENDRKKSSHKGIQYEFLDIKNLPDDAIILNEYNKHKFENYYYSSSLDRFMYNEGIQLRLMHINYTSSGSAYVNCRDVNNVNVKICYNKFKKHYIIN